MFGMRAWQSKLFRFLLGLTFLSFSALCGAQNAPASSTPDSSEPTDSGSSIAAAAKKAKEQKKEKAKKVYTDEDMEAASGPLPRLKMEGADNTDDVVAAIIKYKISHTPQQTEEAVHAWYDRYDQILATAIKESLDINTLRNINASNSSNLCADSADPQECRSRQTVNMIGLQSDTYEMTKNFNLENRIRQALLKVQVGLLQSNLHYDWFKIRNTNNPDQ